jgi:hypothetical protein
MAGDGEDDDEHALAGVDAFLVLSVVSMFIGEPRAPASPSASVLIVTEPPFKSASDATREESMLVFTSSPEGMTMKATGLNLSRANNREERKPWRSSKKG